MDLRSAFKAINAARKVNAPAAPTVSAEEKAARKFKRVVGLLESLKTRRYTFMATVKGEDGNPVLNDDGSEKKVAKSVKLGAGQIVDRVTTLLKLGMTPEGILVNAGVEFLNVKGLAGQWHLIEQDEQVEKRPIRAVCHQKAHRKVKGTEEKRFNEKAYRRMVEGAYRIFGIVEPDTRVVVAAE